MQPTVVELQSSALDLLDRMIAAKVTAARITPDEATYRMKLIIATEDRESGHYSADQLLRRIAKESGFHGAVAAYDKMPKWYA